MYSYMTHLQCPKCKQSYEKGDIHHLCECGSPLLVQYDLERVKHEWTKDSLAEEPLSLWRYHPLLPVEKAKDVVTFGEGMTPLLPMHQYGATIGLSQLFMKDEGLLPTGSFKARGAAVGVSMAKALGVKELAMPTNGNAGAAWAQYGARAGLRSHVVMPEDAPEITRKEVAISGGHLTLIDGLISDAGKVVAEAIRTYGYYDASTLKEPYRIEGKKTMGLEICEQLKWTLPDVILYPTGGGVGLIGIYKAIQELRTIGWVKGEMPRLVAVQAEGCAPIVDAFHEGRTESTFFENAHTTAFGINVPKAIGDFLVLEAIYETSGCAIALADEDILHEQQIVAQLEGAFLCPEGAATFAAAKKLVQTGWIKEEDVVICLNTGMGVKYPESVQVDSPVISKNGSI